MNRSTAMQGITVGVVVTLGCLMTATTGFGYSSSLFDNGVLWHYGYEGDTYPTNEFPFAGKWTHDAQGGDTNNNYLTAQGFVVDTSPGGSGMGYRLSGGIWFASTNIWTVEMRMRILSTNANYVGGVDFRQSAFNIGSVGSGFLLRMSTNTVELRGATFPIAAFPVGHDWNTYRVTVVGTNVALYINTNHTPILTVAGGTGSGTTIEFGDYGLFGSGAVEYDYLRWTWGQAVGDAPIPEPGVAILLAAGGTLLLRRRTRA